MAEQGNNDLPIGSGINYHPYILALAHLDAEWSRRYHYGDSDSNACNAFERVFDELDAHSRDYRTHLEKNLNIFRESIKLATPENHSRLDQLKAEKLKPHLYNPRHYIPVGHSDTVSLVLFDDFDPFHAITSNSSTTVEEVGMAFCPRLKPVVDRIAAEPSPIKPTAENPDPVLNVKDPAGLRDWILEPHEFFPTVDENPGSEKVPELSSQFFLLSRFKLNAMAALGTVLNFQSVLTESILRVAAKVCNLAKSDHREVFEKFEITQSEIESLRMTVVDLQGQEEIAILFHTHNLSLPMAILSRLQALTLGEMFELEASKKKSERPPLKELFLNQNWLSSLNGFCDQINSDPDRVSVRQRIPGSHVFRWLRSSPGLPREWFFEASNSKKLKGFLHAVTELQISSGHQANAEEQVLSQTQIGNETPIPELPPFRLHQLGHGDVNFIQRPYEADSSARRNWMYPPKDLLSAESTVKHIANQLHEFGEGKNSANPHNLRNVIGMTSIVSVPVPIIEIGEDDDDLLSSRVAATEHGSPIEEALPIVRRRLMHRWWLANAKRLAQDEAGDSDKKAKLLWRKELKLRENEFLPDRSACLDPHVLHQAAKFIGVPLWLRRALGYLYQNFTTTIANPYCFDSILDLFDCFATLQSTILEIARQVKDPDSPQQAIKEDQINQLALFVSALHRTLQHRLYRAFPEDPHRDMDIDFRGGLNQPLHSADAVLKCAVGVLRNCLLSDGKELNRPEMGNPGNDRSRIGIVSHVGFRPGIRITCQDYGVEQFARLGLVNMDVPHTVHLPAYVDLLHESFHLVYNELRLPSTKARKQLYPTVPPTSQVIKEMDEVFGHFLSVLFLCRDEPQNLAIHLAVEYSASNRISESSPNQPDAAKGVRPYCDLLLKLFYVDYLIALINPNPDPEKPTTFWKKVVEKPELVDPSEPEDHIEKLENLHNLLSPLLPRIHWREGSTEGLPEQLKEHFEKVFPMRKPYLLLLAERACEIYDRFWNGVSKSLDENEARIERTSQRLFRIERRIKEVLDGDKGEPVSWVSLDQAINQGEGNNPDTRRHVDTGFLCYAALATILKQRVRQIFREENTSEENLERRRERHWTRQNKERDANLTEVKAIDYADFLIDPQSSSLFCCIPSKREDRILRHVAVVKSLWKISSHQRSKRFVEMLRRAEAKTDPPNA